MKLLQGVVLVWASLLATQPTVVAQDGDDVSLPVREALDEGRALFDNLEQSAAIERFGEAIDTLRPVAERETLSVAQRRALLDALSFRARAAFNIGRSQVVAEDLDFAIRLEPRFACADRLVSPVLIAECSDMHAELIGVLDLRGVPGEAEVLVNGQRVIPSNGPFFVVAGPHRVEVTQAGYERTSDSVDVAAGPSSPTVFDVVLTRVSSVLQIVTRPFGATVHIDTVPYGPTSEWQVGEASTDPVQSTPDGQPRQESSKTLVVPGLLPGVVSIVVTKEGFRTVRTELELVEPADYPQHFVLERAEGTVVFEGDPLPPDSTIEVQRRGEEALRAVMLDAGRLTLPIGVYALSISHPSAGYFRGTATVVDRQEYRVRVRIRPTAVLLGVLGDDDTGRGTLMRALTEVFDDVDGWTFQNRIVDGARVLDDVDLGLSLQSLQWRASPFRQLPGEVDWSAVQAAADEQVGGSIYVLAVVNDDSSSRHADLWLWRSAPAPAAPTRVRVALGSPTEPSDLAAIAGRAFADVSVSRAWIGALVLDSGVDAGPVVAAVTDGGPANSSGMSVGDVIIAVNEVRVRDASDMRDRVTQGGPGSQTRILLQRAGVTQEVLLIPGESPNIVPLSATGLVHAVLAASLPAALDRLSTESSRVPDWVWRLNTAATLLTSGNVDGALDVLRSLQPAIPDGAGVAKGALWYWLGLAYRAAGPQFLEPARRSFQQAAADPTARLHHHDGPWVAPRARARLAQLEISGTDAVPDSIR